MSAFLENLLSQANCLTNAYAVEEARRNLAVKLPARVSALERWVARCEMIQRLPSETMPIELPPKDIPILGGAIAGRATHLLTGDARDFGRYMGKTVAGVKIVSPRMLSEGSD